MAVTPIATFEEYKKHLGEFIHQTDIPVTTALSAYDATTKAPLFILQKQVLSPDLLQPILEQYLPLVKKMNSSNRGFAAGNIQRYQHGTYEKSNKVNSTVAGYIDSPNHKYPCRLTKFSNKHFQAYQSGLPLLEKISQQFANTLPEQYAAQWAAAEKTPFRIPNTAFTTVTMNYNFQTAIHLDKGDYAQGFGILVVCSEHISGGELLFPRYRLRIPLRTGDLLFMNVHEYHCNLPIVATNPAGYRLSLVCYLREKLLDCKQNQFLRDLGLPENKYWDTSLLINKILQQLHFLPSEKQITPEGWSYENDHYHFYYRKKQYILKDKRTNKKSICLYRIMAYLETVPPQEEAI